MFLKHIGSLGAPLLPQPPDVAGRHFPLSYPRFHSEAELRPSGGGLQLLRLGLEVRLAALRHSVPRRGGLEMTSFNLGECGCGGGRALDFSPLTAGYRVFHHILFLPRHKRVSRVDGC